MVPDNIWHTYGIQCVAAELYIQSVDLCVVVEATQ